MFLPVFCLIDRKLQPEAGKDAETNHQFSIGPTSGPHHMADTCLQFWLISDAQTHRSEQWDEDVCEHTGVRFSRPYTRLRENKQAASWQAEPQTWCTQCSQNITMSSHITEQIYAGWIALSTKHTHTHVYCILFKEKAPQLECIQIGVYSGPLDLKYFCASLQAAVCSSLSSIMYIHDSFHSPTKRALQS